MAKVIDLGNDVSVRIKDDGYEIVTSSRKIRIDKKGEVLSCEKISKDSINFYATGFIKIGTAEKELIKEWYSKSKSAYVKERAFCCLLEEALQTKYEYFIGTINSEKEKTDLEARMHLFSQYKMMKATTYEKVLWVAYNLIQNEMTYEETAAEKYIFEEDKLYVLK